MRKVLLTTITCAFLGLGVTACTSSPTQESAGQYIDSSVITTKVKTALLASKGLDSTGITVKSYKGVVQLSGFVNSQDQKDQAEAVAKGVEAVNKVENDLIVK